MVGRYSTRVIWQGCGLCHVPFYATFDICGDDTEQMWHWLTLQGAMYPLFECPSEKKIEVYVHDRVKCKNLYLSKIFLVRRAYMLPTRELLLNKEIWRFKTY